MHGWVQFSCHSDLIFHRICHISQNFWKYMCSFQKLWLNVKKNQVSCHIYWCWGKNYVFLLKVMVYESFCHIFILCFFIFLSYMPEFFSTIHLVGSSLLFVPSHNSVRFKRKLVIHSTTLTWNYLQNKLTQYNILWLTPRNLKIFVKCFISEYNS